MKKTPIPLKVQLQRVLRPLAGMKFGLFIALLVVLYGYLGWHIQSLSTAQPTPEAIAAESQATSRPKIDQALVDKIKQLEETNVTVKALFVQARQNPFKE